VPFPRSKKVHNEASLYEYALGALGRGMRTVAEMKRLMRQKQVSGDKEATIDAVVARLKEHRLLNDTAYASAYSSSRKDNQKFGRQRVILDLKTKGVHGEVIEKAINTIYGDGNDEQLAREYITKKRLKQPTAPKRGNLEDHKRFQRETARIFRTLVRAGFRTGTILSVLKKWDVEDEVLLALEEEAAP
jgi:regulatory protein